MAIGWLTVLQNVPWGEVVKNAPMVAAGAKKLWKAVTKKTDSTTTAPASSVPPPLAEAQSVAALTARVSALELGIAELHQQMLASSELINALAEQNTQLIGRIETMRKRLLWLVVLLGVFGFSAAVSLMQAGGR